VLRLVDNDTTAVKTKDIIADAARPPRLHLVLVSEEFLSGVTTAVVELRMRQNSEQSALAGVNVSNHCHPVVTTV